MLLLKNRIVTVISTSNVAIFSTMTGIIFSNRIHLYPIVHVRPWGKYIAIAIDILGNSYGILLFCLTIIFISHYHITFNSIPSIIWILWKGIKTFCKITVASSYNEKFHKP